MPHPAGSLRQRFELATASASDAELLRLKDEFHHHLAADDPEAVAMFEEVQREAIGPDPMAEGACDWPDELAVRRGPVLEVPLSAPLYGWRMWHVDGDRLTAPFLAGKWRLDRKAPGVEWARGVNKTTAKHCRGNRPPKKGQRPAVHPTARCRCGIRVVQSLTVLRAFAEETGYWTSGVPAAIARVSFWGRVAPWAPDDDWRFTARAQHVAIVGDLTLPPDLEHLRPGLVRRYGPALQALA